MTIALLIHSPHPAAAQKIDPVGLAQHGLVQASEYIQDRPPLVIAHGDSSSRANPQIFDRLIRDLSRDFNVFFYTYQRNMIRPRDPIAVKRAVEGFVGGVEDVEEASTGAADAIRELLRQTSAKTIYAFGHSLGGVVLREAATVDRETGSALGSNEPGAPQIVVVLAASPQQGVNGLRIVPVPGLNRALAEAGGLATWAFSSFFGPLGDRDHPFMRGALGRNVTLCQVITDESDSDENVVTEEGQRAVDPAAETPSGHLHFLKAGHVEVITDHAGFLANLIRDKAGLPRREPRVRRVSMLDGGGAGGSLYFASAPDMTISVARDVVTTVIGGDVGPTQTTTRDTTALNDDFRYEWDVQTIAVDASVGVLSAYDGRVRVVAEGSIGRADASLVVRDAERAEASTTDATTFATDGLAWQAGVRGVWTAAAPGGAGMFVEAAYRYERVGDLDVVRDPPFAAPPNVVITETDRLGFRAHVVEGRVGYATGAFSASAGLRQASRRTELSGAVTATSTVFDATQALLFVNRFTERTTEILGRASVQVGNTPLALHVAASRGGGWSAVSIGATIAAAMRR